MMGAELRADPMRYAREREAKIERAQQLRERRRQYPSDDPGRSSSIGRSNEAEQAQKIDTLFPNRERQRRPRRKEICPGWTQHTCKKTGRLYYHHAATNKTTWTRPVEAAALGGGEEAASEIVVSARDDQSSPVLKQDQEERQMTESEFERWITGFTRLTVSQTRRLSTLVNAQLSNLVSREDQDTRRRRPSRQSRPEWNHAFAIETPEVEDQHTNWRGSSSSLDHHEKRENEHQQHNKDTQPLPPGWTKHRDKRSGQFFYRNEDKQESTWTRPARQESSVLHEKTSPGDQHQRYRSMWRPTDDNNDHHEDSYASKEIESHKKTTSRKRNSVHRGSREQSRAEDFHNEKVDPTEIIDDTRHRRRPTPNLEEDAAVALDDNCHQCGRAMNSQALNKMQKVHGIRCCPKCAPKKKRKQFNAAARRADAIAENPDDKQLLKSGIAAVKRDQKDALKKQNANQHRPPATESKWKAQSDQLRQAMKSMRNANLDIQKNGSSSSQSRPPQPSAPDPTLVACPHCGRRFNDKAAERHIPKCRDIKAKPRTLKRGGSYA